MTRALYTIPLFILAAACVSAVQSSDWLFAAFFAIMFVAARVGDLLEGRDHE